MSHKLHLQLLDQLPRMSGYITLMTLDRDGKIKQVIHQKNMIVDGAAYCLANLLLGDASYKVGSIYFEYVNLADPYDMPNPPSYAHTDGIAYFTGLQFSADVDFLRVPVTSSAVITETIHDSYLISFFAITPGDEFGFWNKPFKAANNSAVYGGALVATPVYAVQSSDVVIARTYPTNAKVLKPDGEQIAAIWNLEIQKPV